MPSAVSCFSLKSFSYSLVFFGAGAGCSDFAFFFFFEAATAGNAPSVPASRPQQNNDKTVFFNIN